MAVRGLGQDGGEGQEDSSRSEDLTSETQSEVWCTQVKFDIAP